MKKIFIILIIILAILGVFWYLGSTNNAGGSLSTSVSAPQSADAKNIYSLLQKMNQVSLNDSIFSDPIFAALKDNTVTLSPQASGRNNPFSPVGSDGSSFVQTSTTTGKAR